MEYYKEKGLEDLEDEYWVDVFGFDGVYQVSNLGRFKSLSRWVKCGKSQRLTKDLILSQSIRMTGNRCDGLTVHMGKTWYSSKIIFISFFPDVDFGKDECVSHLNKKILDNRINNLKKTKRAESTDLNMSESKLFNKAYKSNLDKAKIARAKMKDRAQKQCSKCKIIKPIALFVKNRATCKDCRNKYCRDSRKNK